MCVRTCNPLSFLGRSDKPSVITSLISSIKDDNKTEKKKKLSCYNRYDGDSKWTPVESRP